MKKMGIGLLLLFVVFGLAGCGEKKEATTESSAAKQDNPLEGLSEKDVVSEEETEVDGEKIVIKTLKDGQTIALPSMTRRRNKKTGTESFRFMKKRRAKIRKNRD